MNICVNWTEQSIAWMAGLFEGEGCILAPTDKGPLRIKIGMGDKDVLEKFHGAAGCGCVSGPWPCSGIGKRPYWEFAVSGRRAYALAAAMWLHLGSRRREQVARAFRALAAKPHYRKLSHEQVCQIRNELARGKYGVNRALARQFKVTDAMISAIKHRRAW